MEMEVYDSPLSEDGRTEKEERERKRDRGGVGMGGLTRGRGCDEGGGRRGRQFQGSNNFSNCGQKLNHRRETEQPALSGDCSVRSCLNRK